MLAGEAKAIILAQKGCRTQTLFVDRLHKEEYTKNSMLKSAALRFTAFGRNLMVASYKKLWKLLIDKDMKKKELEELAGISHYTINKLNHGANITTNILEKICDALDCTMDDIMEFVPDKKE